jgi:carbamoyl-phosphate synthase large subunit
LLGITVLTALDTANALADIIASQFTEDNTELVDINALRTEKLKLNFTKMQSCGNDFIVFDNRDGKITCPESIAVNYVDPHYGIGGDGIVLIEDSAVADAKIRIFNRDGKEAPMGGNAIRCIGKYLYEKNIVRKNDMKIEAGLGVICEVKVYSFSGKVNSASVNFGKVLLDGKHIPCVWDEKQIVGKPIKIDGVDYNVTLVNVGNPHCVVFSDKVDAINIPVVGPAFEHSEYFPEGVNTEFIRVVNKVNSIATITISANYRNVCRILTLFPFDIYNGFFQQRFRGQIAKQALNRLAENGADTIHNLCIERIVGKLYFTIRIQQQRR